MTTQNNTDYLRSLINQFPHMTNEDIAALGGASVGQVSALRGRGPKREKLAPVFGAAFADTPAPQTPFEHALKDAGLYATVQDAARSVQILRNLLDQARRAGDKVAEFAVVQRAVQSHYRAASHDKTIQAEAFRRFTVQALEN